MQPICARPSPPSHRSLVVSTGDGRNELVAAECLALSGVAPVDGLAMGGQPGRIAQAAYQRLGADVIAQAPGLTSLLALVHETVVNVDRFHLRVLCAMATPVAERQRMLLAVADAIRARPDLTQPQCHLLLIVQAGLYTLARVTSVPTRSYLEHAAGRRHASIALPTQLARGLVNLLPAGTRTLLDPCCGSGTIPLEAAAVGLDVFCGDRAADMAAMARANLGHFGRDIAVAQVDVRAWTQTVDAVVTDLPYERYAHAGKQEADHIIEHAVRLAPVGVFVAGADLTAALMRAGYARVDVFRVPKQAGFMRFVHRATHAVVSAASGGTDRVW